MTQIGNNKSVKFVSSASSTFQKHKRMKKLLLAIQLLFFTILAISPAFSQNPYSNGLIVHLKFEGNVLGEPGSKIDGNLIGSATYEDGFDGKAISFDGESNQFVTLGNLSKLNFGNDDDFTIQIWVKTDYDSTLSPVFFSNSDIRKRLQPFYDGFYGERNINDGWSIYSTSGTWGWNIGNEEQNFLYEPTTESQPINDNKWHQIVFSHNSDLNEVRLYLDGNNLAVYSIGDLKSDFISNLPICIGVDGRADTSDVDFFRGQFDNVAIWNRALSDQEITDIYTMHFTPDTPTLEKTVDSLTVLSWNILHGATRFTKEKDGFDSEKRTIDMIQQSGADIVLIQEAYGSSAKIASSLGYYLMVAGSNIGGVWGSNLVVMSRFPMQRSFMLEKNSVVGVKSFPLDNYAFYNSGVKIKISDHQDIIVFSNWYDGRRTDELESVLHEWGSLFENADSVPIIFGGDFNSISHLDNLEPLTGHSRIMERAGFIDSYRALNPNADSHPGYTCSSLKRIDYIFYKGNRLKALQSGLIDPNFNGTKELPFEYPSDHGGIVSTFYFNSACQKKE